jgi:hypothetical protein
MRRTDPTAKAVIFTQFRNSHKQIVQELNAAKIKCVQIHGAMTQKARSNALTKFITDPEITCFCLSMRSGAVGLTLTAASRCFLMEPCVNEGTELQAYNRVHRMGQTREVKIITFAMRNSIEERILQLRQERSTNASRVIGGAAAAVAPAVGPPLALADRPDASSSSAAAGSTAKTQAVDVASTANMRREVLNADLNDWQLLFGQRNVLANVDTGDPDPEAAVIASRVIGGATAAVAAAVGPPLALTDRPDAPADGDTLTGPTEADTSVDPSASGSDDLVDQGTNDGAEPQTGGLTHSAISASPRPAKQSNKRQSPVAQGSSSKHPKVQKSTLSQQDAPAKKSASASATHASTQAKSSPLAAVAAAAVVASPASTGTTKFVMVDSRFAGAWEGGLATVVDDSSHLEHVIVRDMLGKRQYKILREGVSAVESADAASPDSASRAKRRGSTRTNSPVVDLSAAPSPKRRSSSSSSSTAALKHHRSSTNVNAAKAKKAPVKAPAKTARASAARPAKAKAAKPPKKRSKPEGPKRYVEVSSKFATGWDGGLALLVEDPGPTKAPYFRPTVVVQALLDGRRYTVEKEGVTEAASLDLSSSDGGGDALVAKRKRITRRAATRPGAAVSSSNKNGEAEEEEEADECELACDKCETWYASTAVGLTVAQAEALDVWVCPACTAGLQTRSKRVSKASVSVDLPIGKHVPAVGCKVEVAFSTGRYFGSVTKILGKGKSFMVHFPVDDTDSELVPGRHQYRSIAINV